MKRCLHYFKPLNNDDSHLSSPKRRKIPPKAIHINYEQVVVMETPNAAEIPEINVPEILQT